MLSVRLIHTHLVANSVTVIPLNDPHICHFIVSALNATIKKHNAIYNSTSGILKFSACSLHALNVYA